MKKLLNLNLKKTLALAILGGGLINASIADKADAAIIVKAVETGTDVEFTLSGSLDVSGLDVGSDLYAQGSRINPEKGDVVFNPTEPVIIPELDVYINLIDNPSDLFFGNFLKTEPTSVSGDAVVIGALRNRVRLPLGYSGGDLNSSMTFESASFASLEINPGVYSATFNGGADTITYDFKYVSDTLPEKVPEPVTIVGTMTALGLGTLMKKHKKENA